MKMHCLIRSKLSQTKKNCLFNNQKLQINSFEIVNCSYHIYRYHFTWSNLEHSWLNWIYFMEYTNLFFHDERGEMFFLLILITHNYTTWATDCWPFRRIRRGKKQTLQRRFKTVNCSNCFAHEKKK